MNRTAQIRLLTLLLPACFAWSCTITTGDTEDDGKPLDDSTIDSGADDSADDSANDHSGHDAGDDDSVDDHSGHDAGDDDSADEIEAGASDDSADATEAGADDSATHDAEAGVDEPLSSEAGADAGSGGDAGANTGDEAGVEAGTEDPLEQLIGDTDISVGEILGFYSGDWGDMVLRHVGDEIWGAYAWDTGTIVGSIQGDALVGWWSETPSREPTSDAGDVEFRWTRDDAGNILLDGRWRYGTEEAWHEDWDISLVTDRDPPQELVERFDDESAFRRHP